MQTNQNTQFLNTAANILEKLNIRYREADLDEQLEMKADLDQAFVCFSEARLAIMQQNIRCTPTDVEKMRQLQKGIKDGIQVQKVLQILGTFTGFLRSRFL